MAASICFSLWRLASNIKRFAFAEALTYIAFRNA
jgi:hypothetical protein